MKLIWTKSSLPLSILIRKGLNEPVSHFGIVFDCGIVFHSNLLGTHIQWYKTFKSSCEIIYELEYPMQLEAEENVYRGILDAYDSMPYDYGAFFYFILRALLYRFFKFPFPNTNAWENKGTFLCTELAKTLPECITGVTLKDKDLGIISPFQLYCLLKAK